MANVFTDLAADIYIAADTVGRELVGVVPSATINGGSERAAVGQTVRSHYTRAATVGTFSAAMTIPEGTDQTVDNKTLTISNTASVKIPWTGEDMKFINGGSGYSTVYGDQIAQAMRAITNQIENEVAANVYATASRAYGTAGTTPFGSDFKDIAQIRKILVDNGMPINDRRTSLVLETGAGANLRNLAQLQKANEGGGTDLLRNGVLLDLQGIMMKESAGISSHTKGTGAGYVTNLLATLNEGETVIAVDTGTGTILAGDVITFAGDTNKYVVTSALSGGAITIAAPGLRQTLADGVALTIGGSYTANLALHQSAVEVVCRPIAMPGGGDAAVDTMMVQDPFSGLVFEVAAYKGYGKAMFDVRCAYGFKNWKPEHTAILLG